MYARILDEDEQAIAAMTTDERTELDELASDWDARVKAMEDRVNVRALVICAPIAIGAIAILIAAWGM